MTTLYDETVSTINSDYYRSMMSIRTLLTNPQFDRDEKKRLQQLILSILNEMESEIEKLV